MMKRFLFVFFAIIINAQDDSTTEAPPTEIEAPNFSRSRALFMTTHEHNVPICEQGLLPAIAEVLGTTYEEIMEGLGGILGGAIRTADEYVADVEARGLPMSKFARSDYEFHKVLGGPQTEALGNAMLGALLMSKNEILQALSATATATAAVASSGDEGNSTSGIDLMEARDKSSRADEKDEEYRIRPLMGGMLLNLTSKTFARFFSSIVLHGLGKSASGTIGTPSGQLRSTMKNLLNGFCDASDYSKDFDTDSEAKTCAIMNVVGVAMACAGADVFDSKCDKETISNLTTWLPETCETSEGTLTMAEYVGKFNFVDRRVKEKDGVARLPLTLPQSVMDEEGFQMFLLYRAARAAMTYTSQVYPCGYESPVEPLIPGWKIEEVVTYYPVGSKKVADSAKDDYPLLMINRPDVKDETNQCQVVIIIRGTSSRYEWGVDLQYQLIPFISGLVAHKGFATLALSTMPNLESYLRGVASESACAAKGMDIIISGHSFGAGFSHVLSLLVAHSFPEDRVHSIGFAAPNTFDAKSRDYFREHVNGRSIAVDLDLVSVAPCGMEVSKYGHPRCNGVVDTGSGFLEFQNHAGALKVDLMETVGGKDALDLDNIIGGAVVYVTKLRIDYDVTIPPPLQLGVSHVCAYTCRFSKYCKSKPSEAWECADCPAMFKKFEGSISLSPSL